MKAVAPMLTALHTESFRLPGHCPSVMLLPAQRRSVSIHEKIISNKASKADVGR
jgi:hypothetical protein